MNIYLTESEYDAISFAWSQIATEIEASSDDSFTTLKQERLSANSLLYKTNTEKQKEKEKYSMQ